MKRRKLKAAASDFLPNALPETRKDQFFFLVRNNSLTLFFLGLWLALCFAPIIIAVFFQNRFEVGFYQKFTSGELSEADYKASMNVLMIYGTLLETVFTFVASLALSGANRVYKSLLWGEGVLFKDDFKRGIKQNYLNTSLLFFFFGVLLSLCRFVSAFFLEYFIGIPFYVLLVLIVIPVFMIASIFSSVYECNVFRAIWNATKLYFPYWWQFLLISLGLSASLYGLSLLESAPLLLALIHLASCIFVLPLLILLLYSLCFSLFDKYINREQFKDYYLAGLYKAEGGGEMRS